MINTNRWTALAAAALLGVGAQGCVVSEELTEVRLFPEGPLSVRLDEETVLLYVQTDATGSVRLVVNGEESDVHLLANEQVRFRLAPRGVGVFRIQARVYDGAYPVESNVLELTVRAGSLPGSP